MSYVTFAFVANRPGHDKSEKARLRLVFSAEELGGRRFTGLPERDSYAVFRALTTDVATVCSLLRLRILLRGEFILHLERNRVDVQAPAALVS
jgi:hypothetical protein